MFERNSGSFFLLIVAVIIPFFSVGAQTVNRTTQTNGTVASTIQTGVPFLLIAPDAMSAAMGDVGVATSPDANAIHWNASKMAFIKTQSGFSFSYAPWLRSIISDINLLYLSAYRRMDERNTMGGSLRYFSLGNIQLTDANQNPQGTYRPNEVAIDLAFARQFGENLSLGMAARYIRSSFSNGQFISGQELKPANGFAVDLSTYYKYESRIFDKDADVSFGAIISNIGSKISYSATGAKYSLPTNLRLGGSTIIDVDNDSKVIFSLDLNKLLVPIAAKYDPSASVVSSIFESFSDSWFEEFREISYSAGAEYWLKKQFSLRFGYLYEDPKKGNRQYFTTGIGLVYQFFGLDIAYILASPEKSPLGQTLRFTTTFNFSH